MGYIAEIFVLKKIKPSLLPGIIWLLISTYLLTMPGNDIPKENFFTRIYADKWVHISMFLIMVVLWCWAWYAREQTAEKRQKAFIIIAIIWLAWGAAMEFVQLYLVSNRSFDGWDIVADGVGCALGLVFSLKRYIKK